MKPFAPDDPAPIASERAFGSPDRGHSLAHRMPDGERSTRRPPGRPPRCARRLDKARKRRRSWTVVETEKNRALAGQFDAQMGELKKCDRANRMPSEEEELWCAQLSRGTSVKTACWGPHRHGQDGMTCYPWWVAFDYCNKWLMPGTDKEAPRHPDRAWPHEPPTSVDQHHHRRRTPRGKPGPGEPDQREPASRAAPSTVSAPMTDSDVTVSWAHADVSRK